MVTQLAHICANHTNVVTLPQNVGIWNFCWPLDWRERTWPIFKRSNSKLTRGAGKRGLTSQGVCQGQAYLSILSLGPSPVRRTKRGRWFGTHLQHWHACEINGAPPNKICEMPVIVLISSYREKVMNIFINLCKCNNLFYCSVKYLENFSNSQ